MSGTLARPAAVSSLPGAAFATLNTRRVAVAALAVVAVHALLLAVRPGASAGSFVAPSAPRVMAIRMVRPAAPVEAVASIAQAGPATMPAPASPTAAADRPAVDPAKSSAAGATTGAAPSTSAGRAAPARDDGSRRSPTAATSESHDAEASLAAAPDYAFGVRLDPGPRPLADIEPNYPDMTHLREGLVVLRLLISETGRVDNVAVVRAEPRGVFEQAALDAFWKARFSPGLAAGTPVKSQITVEVQFMPINRGAKVSGRTY